MPSQREIEKQKHIERDPEETSEFADTQRLAREKGTPQGVDPRTGERAAVTYQQLVEETGGDEAAAQAIFRDVAKAGGFGDVGLDQSLDVRSLERSSKAFKDGADRGVDLKGGELDKAGTHGMRQAAQHQDRLVNEVGEALERLRKG